MNCDTFTSQSLYFGLLPTSGTTDAARERKRWGERCMDAEKHQRQVRLGGATYVLNGGRSSPASIYSSSSLTRDDGGYSYSYFYLYHYMHAAAACNAPAPLLHE
eukprot:scaffold83536_cov41-Prasinocladus_malaysianus.AAC.1